MSSTTAASIATREFSVAFGSAVNKGVITAKQRGTLMDLVQRIRREQGKPQLFTFSDLEAARKAEATATGDEKKQAKARVDALKANDWFACGDYTESRRVGTELISVSAVVGDADVEGVTTLEGLKAGLEALNVSYLIASSTSHKCEGAGRFRVVIPLDTPIAADRYPAVWQWVNERLGGMLSAKAADAERLSYLPKVPRGAVGHGVIFVDHRPWLDPSVVPTAGDSRTDTTPSAGQGQYVALTEEQRRDTREAIMHPATLAAGGDRAVWATHIGLPLIKHGRDDFLALFGEYSRAAPGYVEGCVEEFWEMNKNQLIRSDYRHILKFAESLPGGWVNSTRSAKSMPATPGDFKDVDTQGTADTSVQVSTPAPAMRKRFVPMPVDQFVNGLEPEWIIDGIVPRSELMVVFGEPGCGKSFFVADMAAAVARGVKWRDREVIQGCVVYVCAESASGFRQRWRAYANTHRVAIADLGANLFMITDAPNLLNVGDVGELCERLRALGVPLALVVIDTLARATPGANENSGEDMGKALAHCKAIHTVTGALVCLVHHSGKDQARGARGWSGIRGATDTEIEITRQAGAIRQAVVSKQRDGEDGMKFEFELAPAVAGRNAKGEPQTSLVVRPVDPRRESVSPITRPTGVAQRAIWDSLSSAMRAMMTDELITAAVSRLVYDPGGGRDRRREIARRAIEAMLSNGLLVQDGPGYNLPRPLEFQNLVDASDLIGDIKGYGT